MKPFFIFLFCFHALFTCITTTDDTTDTLTVNQIIRDGQTIVSPQQTFELGFFSPGNATQNRYLGIWYKRLATGTVAWVANRETPIRNKSGELTLHPNGVLVLRDSTTNRIIWSSSVSRATGNPVARLSDSGNFVVFDGGDSPENYIWQSFDHPGNTMLPRMKFGRNLERGVVTNFTSWKSDNDPSEGEYMVYTDFNGLPQIFQKNRHGIQYRYGSWNGYGHTGSPIYEPDPLYTYRQVINEREFFIEFDLVNSSALTQMVLTPTGSMSQFNWINRSQGWLLYFSPVGDNCFRYGLCGVYGSCDISQSPPCGCLEGFTPKSPDQWNMADWKSGCEREIPLDCGVNEGFRMYPHMKLPDTRHSWFDTKMTLEQCEVKCRNECNCTAYTTLDIRYGTGCVLWYDELIDMTTFPFNGQDMYIRMAALELEKSTKVTGSKKNVSIIIIPIVVGLAILLVLCLLIIRKKRMKALGKRDLFRARDVLDLPLFSLSTLIVATNNFSADNKLGRGGFGEVHKGFLEDGREVAVKRLSESSSQGVEEFKNEVIFISKLQHRNLVKILGCCIEGEEKLLVYEYMPNKGLDLFIFQETERRKLGWSQRFSIIDGIARGLLYLHQDSRLRIVHRDLKAANILLDNDMNPKISDFGLARSFGGNETETNTKRVAGTFGYMSPEYTRDGIFSTKSDVFSFGILMLEIISGKKNRGFFHQDKNHYLSGHAWTLYKEGKTLEFADESLIESGLAFQVLRSIHIGLLCVQSNPDSRPNMDTVVMMLSGKGKLPEPNQPGFYIEDSLENSVDMQTQSSNNDVTITLLEAR